MNSTVHSTNRADHPNRGDELLANLSSEQREAVTTTASPLCIIAGAGSGKTRVLTRRVAWQTSQNQIDPRRVLVLTFTRRAASELRARLRGLGIRQEVAAATFHSAALALLRRYWDHCQRPHMQLVASRFTLLAKTNPKLDNAAIAALNTEIGWARARLVTPETYAAKATEAQRRPPRGSDFTATAYAAYQSAKQTRKLIDFDDVLALCHQVLTHETVFADAQRWHHRHLFVDEFQDVNPLQFAVLKAWTGPESSLALVGDPNQAIYGWNGANPDFIREIDQHFASVAVVRLGTNYRSTPQVLNAAAQVLGTEPQRAARSDGNAPTVTTTDGDSEGAVLAQAVRVRHQAGGSWRDQAVLSRTNAQLPILQAALKAAGVPTRSRDVGLLRQPEIADLLNRWGSNSALSTALADEQMREPDDQRNAQATDCVATFIRLASDHLTLEPNATVGDFLASLRSDDRGDTAVDTVDAVELATFHAAKGLEWPIVHLVGIEDGLVPINHARSRAAREEEQRLLYVATTRAKQELHVMWCPNRHVNNKIVERAPSPWLQAFNSKHSPEPSAPPDEVRELLQRLDEEHSRSEPTTAHSRKILADLQHWRSATAHAARITPQAVLSNNAMRAIADQQPTTIPELSSIVGPPMAHRFGEQLLAITSRE